MLICVEDRIYLNTPSSLYKVVFNVVLRFKFFIGIWELVDELGLLEIRKGLVISKFTVTI